MGSISDCNQIYVTKFNGFELLALLKVPSYPIGNGLRTIQNVSK